MNYSVIIIAIAVAFFVVRRYQRSLGPQLLQPSRLTFSLVMYGIFGVLLGATSLAVGWAWLFDLLGLAAGGVLAWYSLMHTRFETRSGQPYYIPNPYIGLAVFGLLVLRLGYRFLTLPHGAQAANSPTTWGFGSSPLTLALFFVLVGYFAFYNLGLLQKNRAALGNLS